MKVLIISVIIILLVVGSFFIVNSIKKKVIPITEEYQGPIPEGYNETHFRETGETIENG